MGLVRGMTLTLFGVAVRFLEDVLKTSLRDGSTGFPRLLL